MELIFSARDTLLVNHLKYLLEAEGITCFLRNEFLVGAAGELPPTETWPELWVGETDATRARSIVDDFLHWQREARSVWRCPRCGEMIEGQFDICWQCGENRP